MGLGLFTLRLGFRLGIGLVPEISLWLRQIWNSRQASVDLGTDLTYAEAQTSDLDLGLGLGSGLGIGLDSGLTLVFGSVRLRISDRLL